MVNYETAHDESLIIEKYWWCVLMTLVVVLIWMHWKHSPIQKKYHNILQIIGLLILIFLSVIYKGGAIGDQWMTTQWWGILGLIGWAYPINALVYIFTKGNFYIMIGLFLLFNLLSVSIELDLLPDLNGFFSYFSTIYSGTIPAFTSAGIVATLIFSKLKISNSKWIVST